MTIIRGEISAYAVRTDVLRDSKRPQCWMEYKPGPLVAYYDALDLLYALEREGWQVGKVRDGVWWAWQPATDDTPERWRRVAVVTEAF